MDAAKTGLVVAAAALAGLLWLSARDDAAGAAPPAAPGAFAISGVRVFDGERFVEGATVVVRDGLIAEVGPDVAVPAGVDAAARCCPG